MNQYLTLKTNNCQDCYKCIRHCPVKSIRFSQQQARIIEEECILCGQCYVVCPQNAKQVTSQIDEVKDLINGNKRVVASIAPSFIANYPNTGIKSIENALVKLGFESASETAIGATLVKTAYEEKMNQESQSVIISSCCESVNLLIQKYYPEHLQYLADVKSPMLAHGEEIKKNDPECKVVFIGPCISKKEEAQRYTGIIDNVLTFAELSSWLEDEGIEIEEQQDIEKSKRAAFFPTSGGIIKSFAQKHNNYDYYIADGVERCIEVLDDLKEGKMSNCFIEMSACVGSCVGGPIMEKQKKNSLTSYQQVRNYTSNNEDFIIDNPNDLEQDYQPIKSNLMIPGEHEINAILKQMGKNEVEDQLNCGGCGYDTCISKAIAVYNKKAEISMCLPFLKKKAESFSDIIIGNTPNGIIVLDEQLNVQQINKAGLEMLNIRSANDVVNAPVVRILETTEFRNVLDTKKNIYEKRGYLAEYQKYVDYSILYDKSNHILIYIMKDVTDVEMSKSQSQKIKAQTIEITDRVVENQMKIVQEIAYLLGETAAETKIALTKLKETLDDK